ncbi:MAG: hypothetical protein AB2693_01140, partial [Candidatus Thiodiazotropha sp.]
IDCPAWPKEMFLFHRQTGLKGAEAEKQLTEFKERKMPLLWEETWRRSPLLPTPISSLHPTPPRLASPLDKVYRTKITKGYSNKRTAAVEASTHHSPVKRRCLEEDLDLQHDPVEISLEQPDHIFQLLQILAWKVCTLNRHGDYQTLKVMLTIIWK